jgi:hypothetical protein
MTKTRKSSLAETHPEIAAQAEGWDPTTLTAGSNKTRTWKCEEDHSWNAPPADRVRGQGCPFCAGKRAWPGFNDLASINPTLAAQACGWDPTTTTPGSGSERLWQCQHGHEWLAKVSDRSRGNGCPYCSGLRTLQGVDDLATTHPELALEAHGWDPTTLKAGSNKRVEWKCSNGHVYTTALHSRGLQGTDCPICSNQQLLVGYNDLVTTHPDLAAQADGWDPTTVVSGTNKKLSWLCKVGHSWIATVNSRTLQKTGCPICANKQVLAGYNDLATTHPELAAQADGWDPTTVIGGNHKQFLWKCSDGHSWSASLTNRTYMGSNCPICANKQVLAGYNDLATTHPELAAQADGWDPTTVTANSAKKRMWKCNRGHSWLVSVDGRRKGQAGCPICANQQLLVGYNDLATTHPELALEADGWDPRTVIAGSNKKAKWKCKKGHRWSAVLHNRNKGIGCPICSNQQLLVGYNDLATTHPELALEADGWDPRTVIAGSNKKAKWICEQGHRWSSVIANRSRVGVGCPSCAKFGFDPNQPGFLYLIDHFELDMFQIGITNFPDKRLDKHGRSGWEVIELRGPMDGLLTRQLETNCLHALEQRGAILGHKAGIDKFDGYSEAWTKASLNVTSIKQILDWVYEDESK